MKKILLAFILMISAVLNAQDIWTESVPFNPLSGYHANSISIVDENTVWITGTNYDSTGTFGASMWGVSTDGGQTWNTGILPMHIDLFPANITAVSATTAYIILYPTTHLVQGGIWVTFDSGVTWTQQQPAIYSNGTESFPCSVHFFDQDNGVAIGDPSAGYFEIYTTSNAGSNWIRVPAANIPAPLDGEYVMTGQYDAFGDTIWFGTNKNRLFRSAYKGYAWTAVELPIIDSEIFFYGDSEIPFAFRDENNGILEGDDGSLYETVDGGYNWSEIIPLNGLLWNGFVCRVPQTGNSYFSAGRDATDDYHWGSSYSTNGGHDWTNLHDANDPIYPVLARFYSSSVGYCSAYNGDYRKFYRLTDELNRLLKKESFLTEKAFSATPNPTTDRVQLSGTQINTVQIFDLTGKQIFAESYNGQDEISVNMSTWQNGIYLAKIQSTDGTTASVKIIKE